MRINRSYALAATAWLVLVVVGALLVWAVISRAGEGVLSQPESPAGAVAPVTSPPPAKRADHTKPRKPAKKHHPSASASGSPDRPSGGQSRPGSPSSTPSSAPTPPAPSATTGPAPTPGPGPGPKQSPSNPPPSSPAPAPSPSQQQSDGVRRTWQGSAGAVTVECNGASISLKGAQPNSGWSIDIDRRGPDEVRVDFESNDGERRTRVQAECVGGTPRFEVDQSD